MGVEGDDLHLICRSHSRAVWSYNDGAIPINVKYENENNLVIKNIIKTNEGTYECQGVTVTKQRFRGKISVIITGEYKSKITYLYYESCGRGWCVRRGSLLHLFLNIRSVHIWQYIMHIEKSNKLVISFIYDYCKNIQPLSYLVQLL